MGLSAADFGSQQTLFDTATIAAGTSLCTICCSTIYKLGLGSCDADHISGNTNAFGNLTDPKYYEWYRDVWKFAEVVNTSYEFPCQFGYEEGLCSHTCQPLIHTHLGTATYSLQETVMYE